MGIRWIFWRFDLDVDIIIRRVGLPQRVERLCLRVGAIGGWDLIHVERGTWLDTICAPLLHVGRIALKMVCAVDGPGVLVEVQGISVHSARGCELS